MAGDERQGAGAADAPPAGHEQEPCPVCGRPVERVIVGRRKSLGIFVPEWGPGPCHAPDCPRYASSRGAG
ncbi:hypothetical protein ABZ934_07475 [Streptomyces sp. NPDC046557]|uniref:hypothetical protein n=1 Tax=Streptomyces sp. NPDC046557 TaxID=3155372 RepID=UPI0033F9A2CD